jgi:hypothetical protein
MRGRVSLSGLTGRAARDEDPATILKRRLPANSVPAPVSPAPAAGPAARTGPGRHRGAPKAGGRIPVRRSGEDNGWTDKQQNTLRGGGSVPETIKAEAGQSARSGQAASTDSSRHPVQLGMTAFTLLAGLIAFVAGLIVRLHFAATVLGLAALVVGLYTQMISATRLERILLMAGVIPAFVGVCLGLAHGGFG